MLVAATQTFGNENFGATMIWQAMWDAAPAEAAHDWVPRAAYEALQDENERKRMLLEVRAPKAAVAAGEVEADERVKFEAMMKAAGYGYTEPLTYRDGSYRSHVWDAAWFAYRAAYRALAPKAAQDCSLSAHAKG
jgi:hypothetical protein